MCSFDILEYFNVIVNIIIRGKLCLCHLIFNANIKNMLAGAGTLFLGPLFLTNSLSLIFSFIFIELASE